MKKEMQTVHFINHILIILAFKIHLFSNTPSCLRVQSEPIHQFNVRPLRMSPSSVCIRLMMERHFQGDWEGWSSWMTNYRAFFGMITLYLWVNKTKHISYLTSYPTCFDFGLWNLLLLFQISSNKTGSETGKRFSSLWQSAGTSMEEHTSGFWLPWKASCH